MASRRGHESTQGQYPRTDRGRAFSRLPKAPKRAKNLTSPIHCPKPRQAASIAIPWRITTQNTLDTALGRTGMPESVKVKAKAARRSLCFATCHGASSKRARQFSNSAAALGSPRARCHASAARILSASACRRSKASSPFSLEARSASER